MFDWITCISWASYQTDTLKYRLRMSRKCRQRFPRHRGLAIPTCIKARAVSFEVGGGENAAGIPGACATCNFRYLARGTWRITLIQPLQSYWSQLNHCLIQNSSVSILLNPPDISKMMCRNAAHDKMSIPIGPRFVTFRIIIILRVIGTAGCKIISGFY